MTPAAIERRIIQIERSLAGAAAPTDADRGREALRSMGIELAGLSDDELIRLDRFLAEWPVNELVPLSLVAAILDPRRDGAQP
jgi:hypothetical protein